MLAVRAAWERKALVPSLEKHFKDSVIDVAILESFQKLSMTTQLKANWIVVKRSILGNDVFVMVPTGSSKLLHYASLPYILTVWDGLLEWGVVIIPLLLVKGIGWFAVVIIRRPQLVSLLLPKGLTECRCWCQNVWAGCCCCCTWWVIMHDE